MESLNWTPHMDECVEVLSQSPEWAGDQLLAGLVRMQLVNEQVHDHTPWQSPDLVPPALYLTSLETHLDQIKDSLPLAIQQHCSLQSQHLYGRLLVRDALLHRYAGSPYKPDPGRHGALVAHLAACQAWFDTVFFAVPVPDLVGLPFAIWSHMAACVMWVYRLALGSEGEPGWDRGPAVLHLFALCDALAARCGEVAAHRRCLPSRGGDEDVFSMCVTMIRSLKAGCMAELDPMRLPATVSATVSATVESQDEDGQDGDVPGMSEAGMYAARDGPYGAAAEDYAMAGPDLSLPTMGSFGLPMMANDMACFSDLFNMSWE